LPDVTLPDVTLPDVTLPDVTLPDVTLPDVTLPAAVRSDGEAMDASAWSAWEGRPLTTSVADARGPVASVGRTASVRAGLSRQSRRTALTASVARSDPARPVAG